MDPLTDVVRAQKQGLARGIPSLCSAHPVVLQAAFEQALVDGSSVLVESTCNQVNQEGGYTGVRPTEFVSFVARLAADAGLPAERVVLGGDHLGPNPWIGLGASVAMERASEMVRQYVRAGYAKIHLDASMRCADDPPGPLSDSVAAARTADLAAVAEAAAAERAARQPEPVYVIGTEVPVPGGQAGGHAGPVATRVEDAERGLELTREGLRSKRARARLGARAGPGGPARSRVRRRRRVSLPARGRDQPPRVERAPGAARLRGAFDGLPGRGRPSRPGRGPLRDPQGRPRADVRLPRGGVRAGADRAGAARAAGDSSPLRSAQGAGSGHVRRPAALEGVLRRRRRRRPAPASCVEPQRSSPLLLAGRRRCRKRSNGCLPTSTSCACRWGW